MKKQIRRTKENCSAILIRNVPSDIHQEMKVLAAARGLSLRSLILVVMERELEKHA
jgi:plasmid stability protein